MSDDIMRFEALEFLTQEIESTRLLLQDRNMYSAPDNTGLNLALAYNLDKAPSILDLQRAQAAFEARILEIQLGALTSYQKFILNSNGEASKSVEHIHRNRALKSSAPNLPQLRGGRDMQSSMDFYLRVADALIISPAFYQFRVEMHNQGIDISLDDLYIMLINTVGEEFDFSNTQANFSPKYVKTLQATVQMPAEQQLHILNNLTEPFATIRSTIVSLTQEKEDITQTFDIITNISNRIFNRLQLYCFKLSIE